MKRISDLEEQFREWGFSCQEFEVLLYLIFSAKSLLAISRELRLNFYVVKSHSQNLYRKFKVKNRMELMLTIFEIFQERIPFEESFIRMQRAKLGSAENEDAKVVDMEIFRISGQVKEIEDYF